VSLAADNPTVPVGQAPGYDHLDCRLVEGGVEKPSISIGNQAIANGLVRRGSFVGNVELGDLDRQPEAGNFGEKLPQPGGGERRSALSPQMSLDPDRIDRRPRLAHASKKFEQRSAARLMLGRVQFDIVFVDDEASAGIGLSGHSIGEVEIFRP
jgi:hypothetical protein